MGFWGDFGGMDKDIWWESTSFLELRVFRHLWSRYDAQCRSILYRHGIAIRHRRKFGQVWGSTAPLLEVARKLRCRKAPLWTFDYHTEKS